MCACVCVLNYSMSSLTSENLLGNAIIENTKFQSQVLALTPKMNADELKQLVGLVFS